MRFADIPSLEKEKEALIRGVAEGKIPHARLFLGIEGSAALPLALAYTAFIMCENPTDYDACGSCGNCQKIAKAIHPDVHFVYPVPNITKIEAVSASYINQWRAFLQDNPFGDVQQWTEKLEVGDKQLNIARAESHKIFANLSLKAFQGGYKIMIIWMPEYMNAATANAILKILEEPPEKTLFLLVAANADALLTTIISRCQVLTVPAFSDEEIREMLENKYEVAAEEAAEVALMASGSLSEALRIIEGGDRAYSDFFMNWMRHSFQPDLVALYDDMEEFDKFGKVKQRNLLSFALSIFRGSVLYRFNSLQQMPSLNQEVQTFIEKFAKHLDVDKSMKISQLISEAHYQLERNVHTRLVFLNLSLSLTQTLKSKA